MTDFRALCAELADELDAETGYTRRLDGRRITHPDVTRARTALAQPEPEGPTDEEVLRTYGLAKRDHNYEGPIDDWPKRAERAATVAGLRAVLARWGNHPGSPDSSPQPPADGEVAELAASLERMSIEADAAMQFSDSETLGRAADLLERLSPPQPIPVSERLPGPGDCDAEGRCWWWYPEVPGKTYGYWAHEDDAMERAVDEQPVAWLPAHALALPS